MARSLGFRGRTGDELRYVARIWGARNLTLAVATHGAEGETRRSWLAANVVIDLVDAVSGTIYVRRHRPGLRGAAVALVPPLGAAALALAARREAAPPPAP